MAPLKDRGSREKVILNRCSLFFPFQIASNKKWSRPSQFLTMNRIFVQEGRHFPRLSCAQDKGVQLALVLLKHWCGQGCVTAVCRERRI